MNKMVGNVYRAGTNCPDDIWTNNDVLTGKVHQKFVNSQKLRMTLILEELCNIQNESYFLCLQVNSNINPTNEIQTKGLSLFDKTKTFNAQTINARIISESEIILAKQLGFIEKSAINNQIKEIEKHLNIKGSYKRLNYINGFRKGKFNDIPRHDIDWIIQKDQFTLGEKKIKNIITPAEEKILNKIKKFRNDERYQNEYKQVDNSMNLKNQKSKANIKRLENIDKQKFNCVIPVSVEKIQNNMYSNTFMNKNNIKIDLQIPVSDFVSNWSEIEMKAVEVNLKQEHINSKLGFKEVSKHLIETCSNLKLLDDTQIEHFKQQWKNDKNLVNILEKNKVSEVTKTKKTLEEEIIEQRKKAPLPTMDVKDWVARQNEVEKGIETKRTELYEIKDSSRKKI